MKTMLTCYDKGDRELAICSCHVVYNQETNTHSTGREGDALIVFRLRYEQAENMEVPFKL